MNGGTEIRRYRRLLIKRLIEKGLEPGLIPGFIRSLASSFLVNPEMNLVQVRRRLEYLGWEGFDLDYHTFQLAVTCFESEGMVKLEYKPVRWFESHFVQTNPVATGDA